MIPGGLSRAAATTTLPGACAALTRAAACTLLAGHAGPHRAEGYDGRLLEEWVEPADPEAGAA